MTLNRRVLVQRALSAIAATALAQEASAQKPVVVQQARQQAQRSMAVQASRAGGGHLHKHVGQTNTYLQGRASSTLARANFRAASLGANLSGAPVSKHVPVAKPSKLRTKAVKALTKLKTSPRYTSTFTNGAHADHWYAHVQRSKAKEIRQWMATAKPGTTKGFSFDAGRTIGATYSGRDRKFSNATKGQFVLQRTKFGFFPLTAKLS